jgi:hypothetical protein
MCLELARDSLDRGDPAEVYNALRAFFIDNEQSTLDILSEDLSVLKQNGRKMIDFVTDIRDLAYMLNENGSRCSDAEMKSKLYRGVDRKFKPTVDIISQIPGLKFDDSVKKLLLQETVLARSNLLINRKENEVKDDGAEALSVTMKKSSGYLTMCRNCGEEGHRDIECNRRYCSYCRSASHLFRDCRSPPENVKPKSYDKAKKGPEVNMIDASNFEVDYEGMGEEEFFAAFNKAVKDSLE